MGLRNREPKSLCDGWQSAGSSNRNQRVFTDGGLGLQARLSAAIGARAVRLSIFALPRACRKRHSRCVVRLLRDLLGYNFASDITGVRHSALTVAAAPVSGAG